MYNVHDTIKGLQRDVQHFGLKLASGQQPINKDLANQINSLEMGIEMYVSITYVF